MRRHPVPSAASPRALTGGYVPTRSRRALAGAVLLAAAISTGCSGSSSDDTEDSGAASDQEAQPSAAADEASTTAKAPTAVKASTASTTSEPASDSSDDSTTTLPPGAIAGLDDYNGDGEPDPTCGVQDFGAGLVLRIPCTISSAHEPASDTVLVPNSLFRLPGDNQDLFEGLSGDLVEARDPAGARLRIIIFNSDALFDSGSATIASTGTLDAVVRVVNTSFANGILQVRGHTDATGTVAVNQPLSEQRASNVLSYLRSGGLKAQSSSAVGLASTQPLVLERNPDGSVSDAGQKFNRRVEIVVRLP